MKTEINATALNYLRVAGLLMLSCLIIPALNWALILSRFSSTEGNLPAMIAANGPLFQLNIFNQVLGSFLILALGFVLYRILKDINPTLSVLALLLKTIESVAILVLVMLQFVGLFLIKAGGANAASFLAVIVDNYIKLTSIAGIFMGISMLIWTYLFLKSGFVTKAMAVFGIIAFALVVLYDTLMIFFIELSPPLTMQLTGTLPMLLFQLGLIVLLLFTKYKSLNISL